MKDKPLSGYVPVEMGQRELGDEKGPVFWVLTESPKVVTSTSMRIGTRVLSSELKRQALRLFGF